MAWYKPVLVDVRGVGPVPGLAVEGSDVSLIADSATGAWRPVGPDGVVRDGFKSALGVSLKTAVEAVASANRVHPGAWSAALVPGGQLRSYREGQWLAAFARACCQPEFWVETSYQPKRLEFPRILPGDTAGSFVSVLALPRDEMAVDVRIAGVDAGTYERRLVGKELPGLLAQATTVLNERAAALRLRANAIDSFASDVNASRAEILAKAAAAAD